MCVCTHTRTALHVGVRLLKKKCVKCNKVKPLPEFYKDKRRKDGHVGVCKVCTRLRKSRNDKKYDHSNKGRYRAYKVSAKCRGYEFNITREQFLLFENANCNYCGSKLEQISLDRVDNGIGYEVDNVVPCCPKCNYFKRTLDEEDFLKHVEKIYKYQEGKQHGKQEGIIKEAGKEDDS